MSRSSSRSSTPDSNANNFIYDERKPIDKNLPRMVQVTLDGWLRIWRRLAESGNTRDRDTFALTGHYTDPVTSERCRAQISLESYRPEENAVIRQVSDIDSIIGIMLEDIPLLAGTTIKYFILLSPLHTLKADLHIPPVPVKMEDGSSKVEPRGLVRVYFPFLDPPGGNVCMDEDHMRDIYDLVFYPAAVDVLPEDLVMEWPPKYNDEKFRGTIRKEKDNTDQEGRGRRLQQSERDIHAVYLNPWVQRAREIINNTPRVRWARGLFFGFEMRGVKNRDISLHPPPDEPLLNEDSEIDVGHPRVEAVERLLENFDTTQFEPNRWFLDIATRVTVSDDVDDPAACTFVSTRMHAHLLSHFTELSWGDSVRYATGQGNHFQKDEVAHLNDISGGRFKNPHWAETGVCYVQFYGTDKSVTYNVELAQNAQRTSARRMIKSWDKEEREHFDQLQTAFQNSMLAQGVALRIESRVEFFQYPNCHLRMPDELVHRCLYRIPRNIFWAWKSCRLLSFKSVLGQWMAFRGTFTLNELPEVGSLLLILEYMANALVNRPESGGSWDQVHDTACVHTMRDGQLVPTRPLGALFLPAIRFNKNKQPRVSSQRCLSIHTILYLLGTRDNPVTQMEAFYRITSTSLKRSLEEDPRPWENAGVRTAAPRTSNKQRRVMLTSSERPDDQFAHAMHQPEREEYPSEDEDPEQRESAIKPSLGLTQVVHNYPIQIMAKTPNRAGGRQESWCTLTGKERTEITFSFFSRMENLKKAFETYFIFAPDASRWE
ncbi:hypothetical protein FRC11_005331 [Ceratobasidium sp. 423]|nr:hypothetical protein FRC11_005331 [Ceratobasidium sp. 423]